MPAPVTMVTLNAIWIELKPPQEMPSIPTLPFDQG